MSYDKFRRSHPPSDLITSQDDFDYGDMLVFFLEEKQEEIIGRVVCKYHSENSIQFVDIYHSRYNKVYTVDFRQKYVYMLRKAGPRYNGCTCGANHTSNPNHHLPYCDMEK